MIDVSPYLRRLELAEEWMSQKIDGTLPLIGNKGAEPFIIDIGCIPNKVSWEYAMKIYDQTGVMFWNSNVPNDMHPTTFEEYCEYRKFKTN